MVCEVVVYGGSGVCVYVYGVVLYGGGGGGSGVCVVASWYSVI